MLPGVNYPANGIRFYQEDHNFEQNQKSGEIINRTKDSFSGAIVEGGNVTVGSGTTVNIEKTIAYDNDGNRIEVPITNNFVVPDNANSKIIIRYKETTVPQPKPDGNSIEYRYPDYEIIARTGSLLDGDIPLRQIQVTSGVVTIQTDLRDWRKVKDVNILNKSNLGEIFKGFQLGILQTISGNTTAIRLPRGNIYEVKNKYFQIPANIDLDFSALTNIFRVDGTTQITSSSEIIDKHLYLLLSDTGSLSAMLVPDSDLPGASHSFNVNPILCKDYYATTPTIWNPDENGFYKGNKRIIATLRITTSNVIQFVYELGHGNRYLDVQDISIGNIYTETRWKREHPSCYIPDGSTVAGMSTEAPVLHRILGSTTLPDWRDRFPRNIDLAGGRSIRDTQEDALQGHEHGSFSSIDNLANGGSGSQIYPYNAQPTKVKTDSIFSDGVNGTPRTANETRGKNFAVSIQIVRG